MTKKKLNLARSLQPLATRDYRLLFAAVGIEVFGTGVWTIVMVFQVLVIDDSPLALSAVATGMSLGLFVFSIFGGVVADRYSKRTIIITVQGCTAAVMTVIAVLSLTGTIQLWQVAVASFAMAAGSTFFFPEASGPSAPEGATSAWGDLREGVKYVLNTRWLLWTLVFGASLALIIQGPIEVLLPFLTRERFADPEATFGFLLASYGIGGAIGSLVVSSLRLPRRYLTFMLACWGGGTLPLIAIGVSNSFVVMLVALFVVGATTGAGVVIWGTLLQRLVPMEMIGRVASLDFFVSIAFMPVSIAIAGPLSLLVPIPVIFVIAGVVPPLLAVIAIAAGRMPKTELARPLDT